MKGRDAWVTDKRSPEESKVFHFSKPSDCVTHSSIIVCGAMERRASERREEEKGDGRREEDKEERDGSRGEKSRAGDTRGETLGFLKPFSMSLFPRRD